MGEQRKEQNIIKLKPITYTLKHIYNPTHNLFICKHSIPLTITPIGTQTNLHSYNKKAIVKTAAAYT